MEITDPTLAFLLVTLGLVGIGVEALSPGGFIAGLLGIAALIAGIIGTSDIGPTAVGVGLLGLAVAIFIAAVAFHMFRPLSGVGVITLILAGIFFFDRGTDPTSIPAVLAGCIVFGAFVLFVIERADRASRSPVRYGPEDLAGRSAVVRENPKPRGQVFADGALWQAELAPGSGPVDVGDDVVIDSVSGLTLLVRASTTTDNEDNLNGGVS